MQFPLSSYWTSAEMIERSAASNVRISFLMAGFICGRFSAPLVSSMTNRLLKMLFAQFGSTHLDQYQEFISSATAGSRQQILGPNIQKLIVRFTELKLELRRIANFAVPANNFRSYFIQTCIIILIRETQGLNPEPSQCVVAIRRLSSDPPVRDGYHVLTFRQCNDAIECIISDFTSIQIQLTLLLRRLVFLFGARSAGSLNGASNGANRCAGGGTAHHVLTRIATPNQRRNKSTCCTGKCTSCRTFHCTFAGTGAANDEGRNNRDDFPTIGMTKTLQRNMHNYLPPIQE
jgi:hypothetical protein